MRTLGFHLLALLLTLTVANADNSQRPRISPPGPRRNTKARPPSSTTNGSSVAVAERITQVQAPSVQHDTCLGYYDVSGQFDKEFSCNNTDHRFCCGSCFLRFCCADRGKRLEQRSCTNYNTPDWIKTQPPSPAPTGDTYDPELDRTNSTVYISCGVVALIIAIGIAAKVAYDKATKPPQEMNVHRALADIMRQQGISQYENNNMVPVDSPKDQTPVRTKNHYTPVHSNHGNHGNHGHYGKENLLHGGPEMHDFISSGFVTLGRGHLKAQHSVDDISWQGDLDLPLSYGNHHHDYQHSHMDLTAFTPKPDRPQRMNNILTAATEPYDVSLSRSFQNLSLDLKPDLSKYSSSLLRLNDKDLDDYYPRKHHHQDFHGSSHLAPHGPSHNMHSSSHTLHSSSHNNPHGSSHMLKVGVESSSHQQRQRPRGRVQRAMSQDHVLSPPRTPRRDRERDRDRDSYGLSPYGAMATAAYGSSRNLSSEQLLSVERLQSKDPLLSPVARRDKFRQKAMSRAMSHADMLLPTTPQHERHDRRDHDRRDHERRDHERRDHNHRPKLQTQLTVADAYSTMTGNHLQASSAKRNAFASRRTHTVDHMSYMSGQAYRSGSKNEVTV